MIPGSVNPLLLRSAAATGYTIPRSLRFNSSDSAYLSRTPASAGNRKTWTWSGWVKRSGLGTDQVLLDCRPVSSDSQFTIFYLKSGDTLELSGPVTTWRTTTQVFRDPSAWYHILLVLDTTQSTASDRIKIYVNGTQVTTFATSANPSQNVDLGINQSSLHCIAATSGGSPAAFFNGYLADIWFVDSQALTPSAFGEFDATTGVWNPKAYSGPALTGNSFHLDFADNSAATATALGKDVSGLGNNWTPNNLSVTAGAGNDSLKDSPSSPAGQTDSGAGGTVVGNYATLNPLDKGSSITLSNGNLNHYVSAAATQTARGTLGVATGKWYFEATITTNSNGNFIAGVANSAASIATYLGGNANGWGVGIETNSVVTKYNNATTSSYGTSTSALGTVGIAFDVDAGKIWFRETGGAWLQSGDPATGANAAFTGLSGTLFPATGHNSGATQTTQADLNFGQRPFAYTAPSGFKALCTANLPTPTIANGATAMDVKLYTGNGSTQTISGLNFSGGGPDLVWIKKRSSADDNLLHDVVRGNNAYLVSNSTAAEGSQTNLITSFNSDGFSLGVSNAENQSGQTYAAWCWDAGSSTVTNTAGSITSQVRANASAGFSVVGYTSVGTSTSLDTIGHGLGVAPSLVFIKNRDLADDWWIYSSLFSDPTKDYLRLNSTGAKGTFTPTSYSASSSTIGIRQGLVASSAGQKIILYCFAPVSGYSSFGSYTGNGSTDGPFVYTGFRPRWIMVKRTDAARDWFIYDAARNTFNIVNNYLRANLSDAEGTGTLYSFDFLSNGFKLRSSETDINGSGGTWVYAAFAESPFAYARAR